MVLLSSHEPDLLRARAASQVFITHSYLSVFEFCLLTFWPVILFAHIPDQRWEQLPHSQIRLLGEVLRQFSVVVNIALSQRDVLEKANKMAAKNTRGNQRTGLACV